MLQRIITKGRADSPYILLDSLEGFGEIKGKSYPPDVTEFYGPLIKWFEGLKNEKIKQFELSVKLDYINTSSLKLFMDLMYKLEEVDKSGTKIIIRWFYADDDPEMQEIGEEFETLVDLKFDYISYEKKF